MYNTDIPSKADLPTTSQLIKSTIFALIAAVVILVTIVLPAEHAIDPTGFGRALKLTQMGEIRQQLAAEAEADRIKDRERQAPVPAPASSLLDRIYVELVIGRAAAAERIVVTQAAPGRNDETIIQLAPTQGTEWKLTMKKGDQVQFSWSVAGGVVNYDMHGTPGLGAKETSYKTERGVGKGEGTLTAAFDGTHGWFFRNRGSQPVTITLRTSGAYTEIKKVQ